MRPKHGEHVFALCEGHDQACEVSARPSVTFLFLFYVASVTGVKPKLAALTEFMEYGSDDIRPMADNPDPSSSVT
jgi:hypothetical protein